MAGHTLQKTVLAGAATLLRLVRSFWHIVPYKVLFAVEDLVYYSWILAFCPETNSLCVLCYAFLILSWFFVFCEELDEKYIVVFLDVNDAQFITV